MTCHDVDGVVVLSPRGCLHEGPECDRLERGLSSMLENGVSRIVVDLTEAGHLSARAVGIVAHAHCKAARRRGHLVVCAAHSDHQWLFEITGLARVLEVRGNRAEAVAYLKHIGESL